MTIGSVAFHIYSLQNGGKGLTPTIEMVKAKLTGGGDTLLGDSGGGSIYGMSSGTDSVSGKVGGTIYDEAPGDESL